MSLLSMSADSLIEEVRPVLKDLAARIHELRHEAVEPLPFALASMLIQHQEGIAAEEPSTITWLNSLAVAVLLVRPGWTPDDVTDALKAAAKLVDEEGV